MTYDLEYLEKHSNLPGPRSNLELLYAFMDEASDIEIERCLEEAPRVVVNSPSEFVYACGVAALIKSEAKRKACVKLDLALYANHASWRVRESVCIGFQRSKTHLEALQMLKDLQGLKFGTALEKRAYAAALCEPVLLNEYIDAAVVIDDLYWLTLETMAHSLKLEEDGKVLKKALGYCWSVAICGKPDYGKLVFEKLLPLKANKHIAWILNENLKKKRLEKLDAPWVQLFKEHLK